MTNGMKSSEFMMTLVTLVIGFALIIFGTFKGQDSLVTMGTAMVSTATAGYGISRGLAKSKTPEPVDDTAAAAALAAVGKK